MWSLPHDRCKRSLGAGRQGFLSLEGKSWGLREILTGRGGREAQFQAEEATLSRGRYSQIQGMEIKYTSQVGGGGEEEAILNEDKASKINVKQNLAKLGNYTNITQYANRGYSICIFTLPLMLAFFLACRHAKIFSHSNKNKPPWDTDIISYSLHLYFNSQ